MAEAIDIVWTEKYRPKKVADVVGDAKQKIMQYIINPKTLPNFLFYSKHPGTGKTSMAKAMIRELGCDYLLLNSSDDRTMEVLREKVKQFAMTKSSDDTKKRAILLDEIDGMLKPAQEALRGIMEMYSNNVFFILTCNNVNKVIVPIQSRCVMIPFTTPSKDDVQQHITQIIALEHMHASDAGVKRLIDTNYPNMRNMILMLQDLHNQQKAVSEENIKPIHQIFDDLYALLIQKDVQTIKKVVYENQIDERELNEHFWKRSLDESNLKVLQITCRNERDIANGADPRIIFVTSLVELCAVAKTQ